MSAQTTQVPPIPRETARTAYAVFSRNNLYIQLGEQLETLLEGIQIKLISHTGDRILPLVTIFQGLESLTDAQASDAIRTRIDWKFAFHLGVNAQPLIANLLCEFRQRLLNDSLGRHHFYKLIDRFITFISVAGHHVPEFKNFELLSIVCEVNQSGLAMKVMCEGLETLATRQPGWLRKIAQPHWYGRYSRQIAEFASTNLNSREGVSTIEICADINQLLEEIHRSDLPEIKYLPEIQALELLRKQPDKRRQFRNDIGETSDSFDCNTCPFDRRKHDL